MLRRCVSTVFWLRNSSAAISGFVLRSTTSRASWSSRSVSDSIPVASGLARPCAPVDAAAELPQLSLGLVAVAQSAARVEVAGRVLELGDGAIALAGRGECAPCERPRQRGLDRRADLVGGGSGHERSLGGPRRVAGVEGDGRCRTIRPRGRHRQPDGLGPRLGRSRCTLGIGVAVRASSQARVEHLEVAGPRAAGDQRRVPRRPRSRGAARQPGPVRPSRAAQRRRSAAASAVWKPASASWLSSTLSWSRSRARARRRLPATPSRSGSRGSRRARACCRGGAPPRSLRRAAPPPRASLPRWRQMAPSSLDQNESSARPGPSRARRASARVGVRGRLPRTGRGRALRRRGSAAASMSPASSSSDSESTSAAASER